MKSGAHFHFKKFSIAQDKSTHKVGTDGVLLGAWVDVNNASSILDIGTGTGLIALMLAQRTPAFTTIDAIELEKVDADQATENASQSPWSDKVKIYNTAIQDYEPDFKYDLIVSNPPFFMNSLLPPTERRGQARHTHTLSFEEIISSAKRLLSNNGRLAVILPATEGELFESLAIRSGFSVNRKWQFLTRKHKPIERLLLEFSLMPISSFETGEVLLYDDGNEWSEGYKALTRDFYLKI